MDMAESMDPPEEEAVHFKVPMPDSVRQSQARMGTDRNALFSHALNTVGLIASLKYRSGPQIIQQVSDEPWKQQGAQEALPAHVQALSDQEQATLDAALRYLEKEFNEGPKENLYVHDFVPFEDEDDEDD